MTVGYLQQNNLSEGPFLGEATHFFRYLRFKKCDNICQNVNDFEGVSWSVGLSNYLKIGGLFLVHGLLFSLGMIRSLNQILLITCFLFIGLVSHQASAKLSFFEYWTPVEELLSEPVNQRRHFKELKSRFSNGDFQEILFVGDTIEGPRLTEAGHQKMFESVRAFYDRYSSSDIDWRFYLLAAASEYQPFSVRRNEKLAITTFDEFSGGQGAEFAHWLSQKIRERVHYHRSENVVSLFGQSHGADERKSAKGIREEIRSEFHVGDKNYSGEKSKKMASLLLQLWLVENHIEADVMSLPEFTPFESHVFEGVFFSELRRLGQGLSLGDHFLKKLETHLEYTKGLPQKFLKNSLVIYPQSRWTSVFNGIGPGACLRCSANSYLRALIPGSIQFGVLKDGKELGHIGVYKVESEDSYKKYWYVDLIQSPGLAQKTPQQLELIFVQLQRMALEEGAMLAVSSVDFDSTNFKENISTIMSWDSLSSDFVEVVRPKNTLAVAVERFIEDARVNQASHETYQQTNYDGISLYDSLVRNHGYVRPLAPLPGLTREEKEKYFMLSGASTRGTGSSRLLEELTLYYGSRYLGPRARWRLLQLVRQNEVLVRNSEDLSRWVNNVLFKTVVERDGITQAVYQRLIDGERLQDVVGEIGSTGDPQKYVEEFLPFCPNLKSCIQLMKQGDHGLAGTQALVHLLIPRLEELGFVDWIYLLDVFLGKRQSPEETYLLGEEVLKRLTSWKEFRQFVKLTSGGFGSKTEMGEVLGRSRIFLKHWESFAPASWDLDSKIAGIRFLSKTLSGAANFTLRKKLLRQAESIDHIEKILKLPGAVKSSLVEDYALLVLTALQRIHASEGEQSSQRIQQNVSQILKSIPQEGKAIYNEKAVEIFGQTETFQGILESPGRQNLCQRIFSRISNRSSNK